MVFIFIQDNPGKTPPKGFTVTNSTVLGLPSKLELLFLRIVYFGVKVHFKLQRRIVQYSKKDSGAFHPDMPQGKKGIADSSYKHLNEYIVIHREGNNKEMTNHINCVRACHENIYSRLKVSDILSDRFRGSWEKHDKHKNVFRRMLSSYPV